MGFSIFLIDKQCCRQNRISRCDCWGPGGRLDTKFDQIDLCHISMSYASFVVIWHLMSYNAYDIEIWHQSFWLILVSKRPSGPQLSNPFIRFWLKRCLKIKNKKNALSFFSFIHFENPLYFQPNLKLQFDLSNWPRIKKVV